MANFNPIPVPASHCPQCGSPSFHHGRCLDCHYSVPIAIKLRRLRIAEQLKYEKAKGDEMNMMNTLKSRC